MRFVLLVVFAFLALAAYGQETQNTLEIYIRRTLENFRNKMKTGIPEIGMPILDPLNVPLIDIKIKEGIADVKLKISQLMCDDLSTFNIKTMNVDMATLKLSAIAFLPRAIAQAAEYDLDGTLLGFIPLYGKGKAAFGITDLEIGVETELNFGNGKLQLGDFAIKIQFNQIQVNLEGILGGGNLGDVVNTVINSFGKPIFDSQKGNIEWSLKHVIRNALNNELAKINMGSLGYDSGDKSLYDTAKANAEVDALIQSIRPNLEKIDAVPIPNGIFDFNQGILKGFIKVSNGTVAGISTISRLGNAISATNPVTGQASTLFHLAATDLRVNLQSTLYLQGLNEVTSETTGTVAFGKVSIRISTNAVGEKEITLYGVTGLMTPKLKVPNMGIFTTLVTGLAAKQTLLGIKAALETDVRRVITEGLAE